MHRGTAVTLLVALLGLIGLVGGALAAPAQKMTLTLDWTPNPDHVGIYDAQATGLFANAGLDVSIHSPSDPTAPLKLVAAGDTDLAVSYEQELFFAAAKRSISCTSAKRWRERKRVDDRTVAGLRT